MFLCAFPQVRTRGSIKRRPPSRRFRRSQSDCGDLGGFRAPESSQENGAKEENGDDVFPAKSKAPGSPPPSEGPAGELGSQEKPPLRRPSSRTEKQEEKGRAPEDAQHPQEAVGGSDEEAASGRGRGSPTEEKAAGAQREEPAEVKEEGAGNGEDEPGPRSPDTTPLAGEAPGEAPPSPPGGAEGEQGKAEEGAVPEPGCSPGEAPEAEVSGRRVQLAGRAGLLTLLENWAETAVADGEGTGPCCLRLPAHRRSVVLWVRAETEAGPWTQT